jgi:hypothetical protein
MLQKKVKKDSKNIVYSLEKQERNYTLRTAVYLEGIRKDMTL